MITCVGVNIITQFYANYFIGLGVVLCEQTIGSNRYGSEAD